MASHGGDGGGHGWDRPPGTVRVANAPPADVEDVTLDDGRPKAGTIKNWSPGAPEPDAPATLPRTKPYGTTAFADPPPSFNTMDHEATTRRVAPVVVTGHAVASPAPRSGPAPVPDVAPLIPIKPRPPATNTLVSEGVAIDLGSSPPAPFASGPAVSGPAVSGPAVSGPAVSGPATERSAVQSAPWPPRPSAKPKRSYKIWLILGTVVCVGGGAFAAGWFVRPGEGEPPETAGEAASPASEPASPAEPEPTTEPESSDEPEATAESEPEPTAEPESNAEPEPAAPPAPPTPPAPADREPLSYEGYLVIESSADADVYVQGKLVGKTNATLIARCYSKFVRLKANGAWITAGQPVMITCMETTKVRIDPN